MKILPIFILIMVLFICAAYATGPVVTRRTKNSLTFFFDGAESQHVLVFENGKLARIDEYYENVKTSSIGITYTNDQITSINNTVLHEDFKHNSFEYCDLSYEEHTMNHKTWNEDGAPVHTGYLHHTIKPSFNFTGISFVLNGKQTIQKDQ